MGRFHRKKGYHLIPKIAKLLKENGTKFVWIIIGNNNEILTNQIKENNVEDSIKLVKEISITENIKEKCIKIAIYK